MYFDNIVNYIEYAKTAEDASIINGGKYDKSKGYFIEPTTIVTSNPYFKSMVEEIDWTCFNYLFYDDN